MFTKNVGKEKSIVGAMACPRPVTYARPVTNETRFVTNETH